jgi:hypothetical protein
MTRDPIEHECVNCGEPIAGAHYPHDPIGWVCGDCFRSMSDEEQQWRLEQDWHPAEPSPAPAEEAK